MDKKMNVAYFLGSLNRGGLETLMLDVFRNKELAEYPFIGVYRKSGSMEKEFFATGVPMYRLRPRNAFDLGYVLRLRRLMRRNSITLIHAQTRLDAVAALMASFGLKIKVVTTYHFGSISKSLLTRFVMKHVVLNLYVSEYQKKALTEANGVMDGRTDNVIYNGVSFGKFPLPLKKTDKTNVLTLGSVGNFTSGRSQYFLCRFLKRLREKGVSFDFYFVGAKFGAEPFLYEDCVSYCEHNGLMDSVHFLGVRKDVPQLLSTWDAYLYCTNCDSFGISVVEALSCGLPTFVNDYPVMKEVTQNGEWSVLYESGNVEDLLEKFMAFTVDREAYEERARKASLQVREVFGIQNYLRRLGRCYRSIS